MALNIRNSHASNTTRGIVCGMIASLIAGSSIFGPIPNWSPLYYIMLLTMVLRSLTGNRFYNKRVLLFIGMCALSILISDPPSLFKSWQRLGLMTLVILAVFPICSNNSICVFRHNLLKYSIALCLLIGATGVICYVLGINYMVSYYATTTISSTGAFGGLARHSMILGPCAAIGLVTSLWAILTGQRLIFKHNFKIICLILCFLSLLLSASRSATIGAIIGCIVLLYLNYRKRISKLLGVGIAIVSILIISYPIYEQYSRPLVEKQEANVERGSMMSSREEKWENRIAEFKSSPIFGIGYAAVNKEHKQDYISKTGIVEAGSSYLALLSMIGVVGTFSFLAVIMPILKKLYNGCVNKSANSESILLLSLLSVLLISMIVESYLMAGGSYFCFFFWLILGVADSSN